MISRLTPRRAARAVLLLCVSPLLAALSAFPAEPANKTFDLPTGAAPATLKQFIAQSGVQLMYAPDEVRGVTTNRVKGEFTPGEAIQVLLADTALAGQETKNGAIAVNRRTLGPNAPRAIAN